ncbi:hypothetical protein BJY59DRAFT_696671 [Rhodotorula toruloides]
MRLPSASRFGGGVARSARRSAGALPDSMNSFNASWSIYSSETRDVRVLRVGALFDPVAESAGDADPRSLPPHHPRSSGDAGRRSCRSATRAHGDRSKRQSAPVAASAQATSGRASSERES